MPHVAIGDRTSGSPRRDLRDWATMLLFKCVSKHAQHVFYIASLAEQFNHYSRFRRAAMDKLNEAMKLAYRPEAIQLPIALSDRVWGKAGLREVISDDALLRAKTEDELRALAQKVIAMTPHWALYAPDDEMKEDVINLLRHQRAIMQEEELAGETAGIGSQGG